MQHGVNLSSGLGSDGKLRRGRHFLLRELGIVHDEHGTTVWNKGPSPSRSRELVMSLSWILIAHITPHEEPGLLVPSAVSDSAEDV